MKRHPIITLPTKEFLEETVDKYRIKPEEQEFIITDEEELLEYEAKKAKEAERQSLAVMFDFVSLMMSYDDDPDFIFPIVKSYNNEERTISFIPISDDNCIVKYSISDAFDTPSMIIISEKYSDVEIVYYFIKKYVTYLLKNSTNNIPNFIITFKDKVLQKITFKSNKILVPVLEDIYHSISSFTLCLTSLKKTDCYKTLYNDIKRILGRRSKLSNFIDGFLLLEEYINNNNVKTYLLESILPREDLVKKTLIDDMRAIYDKEISLETVLYNLERIALSRIKDDSLDIGSAKDITYSAILPLVMFVPKHVEKLFDAKDRDFDIIIE
ncbi:MAG: hypothetical protein QXF12_00535 [Candidatus Aenigmatarchaeota archaeon]